MGELAALGAAFFWAISALLFTFAGQRVGAITVNRLRLLPSALLAIVLHLCVFGSPFPLSAEPYRFFWMGLSALFGLVVGESLLYEAFLTVGPRMTMLLVVLAPVFSSLLAALFLGETLTRVQGLAIGLIIAGLIWVILEQNSNIGGAGHIESRWVKGIALGIGCAISQAFSLVTARCGLANGFPALSGLVIRMVTAAVTMWVLAGLGGQVRRTVGAAFGDVRVGLAISGGAVLGSVLAVWLSLVAIQVASIGVASALLATTPVIMLPLAHFVGHERISARSIVGTLVCVGGIGLLLVD